MSGNNLAAASPGRPYWVWADMNEDALRNRSIQPLRSLPKVLGHADNIDFLSASGSARIVEEALGVYATAVDMLGLLNAPITGNLPPAPHLTVFANRGGRSYVTIAGPERLKPAGSAPYTVIAADAGADSGWPTLNIIVLDAQTGQSTNFQCPLLFLLSTAPSVVGRYVVYSHGFGGDDPGSIDDRAYYVGITKQGWAARWAQHQSSARNGSTYRFHEAIRRAANKDQAHTVHACGVNFNEAMAIEEIAVAGTSLYPNGLNMIPGGLAGLRYLAKRGFHPHPKNLAASWDRKHIVLEQFSRHCSRAGKLNPLAAARWSDASYAASVICSNPNNFSVEQVNEIRYMESLGHPIAAIAQRMQCADRRIAALVTGDTYSRVT